MSNKFLSGNIIDQGYYKAFIPNEKQKMTNINILHLISTVKMKPVNLRAVSIQKPLRLWWLLPIQKVEVYWWVLVIVENLLVLQFKGNN